MDMALLPRDSRLLTARSATIVSGGCVAKVTAARPAR